MLGFLAGEMLLTDPAVGQYIGAVSETTVKAAGLAGAVLVVALGNWLQRRGNA